MKRSWIVLAIAVVHSLAFAEMEQVRLQSRDDFSALWNGSPSRSYSVEPRLPEAGPVQVIQTPAFTFATAQEPSPSVYYQYETEDYIRWGNLPPGESFSELVYAHQAVWVWARQGDSWQLYASRFPANQPQWLGMGEALVANSLEFRLDANSDPQVVIQPVGETGRQRIQGRFSGGGATIYWRPPVQLNLLSSMGQASVPDDRVWGEIDLGASERLLAFTWDATDDRLRVRYRISISEQTPYGVWSQPLLPQSVPLDHEGRFLQFEVNGPSGFLAEDGAVPQIEVTVDRTTPSEEAPELEKVSPDGSGGGGGGGAAAGGGSGGGMQSGVSSSPGADNAPPPETPPVEEDDSSAQTDSQSASDDESGTGNPSLKDASQQQDSSATDSPAQSQNQNPTQQQQQPQPQAEQNQPDISNQFFPLPQDNPEDTQDDSPGDSPQTPQEQSPQDQPDDSSPQEQPQPDDSQPDADPSSPDQPSEHDDLGVSQQQQQQDSPSDTPSPSPGQQPGNANSPSQPSRGAGGAGGDGGGNSTAPSGGASPSSSSQPGGSGGDAGGEGSPGGGGSESGDGAGDSPTEGDGSGDDANDEQQGDTSGDDSASGNGQASEGDPSGEEQPMLPPMLSGGGGRTPGSGGGGSGPSSDGERGEHLDRGERDMNTGGPGGGGTEGGSGSGSGGGGGASGGGGGLSLAGQSRLATPEIETATPVVSSSSISQAGTWFPAAALFFLPLWWFLRKKRKQDEENDSEQDVRHLDDTDDIWIEDMIQDEGGWKRQIVFKPGIAAISESRKRAAILTDDGDIWMGPPWRSAEGWDDEDARREWMKKWTFTGHVDEPVETPRLVDAGSGVFLLDATPSRPGAQFVAHSTGNAKPVALPREVTTVVHPFVRKGRLWLVGETASGTQAWSAELRKSGLGGWVHESPIGDADSQVVAVSASDELIAATVSANDPQHMTMYSSSEGAAGKRVWKAIGKVNAPSGTVLIDADAKRCYVLECGEDGTIDAGILSRNESGRLKGRFPCAVQSPQRSDVIDAFTADGQLIAVGKDTRHSGEMIYGATYISELVRK